MANNQKMFDLEQAEIIKFTAGEPDVAKLLIPQELRQAIIDNQGKYGTTIYRSIIDQN